MRRSVEIVMAEARPHLGRQVGLSSNEAAAEAWATAVRLLTAKTPYDRQIFHRSHLAGSLPAAAYR